MDCLHGIDKKNEIYERMEYYYWTDMNSIFSKPM